MYLSKVLIKGSASRNPYEIHRELWKLLPEDAEADRDFLFRVRNVDWNHADILMQSIRAPERSSHTSQLLACKELSLRLLPEQRLRFLLIANPIKTIDDEAGRKNAKDKTKKCRVPLIREKEQQSWIERKFLEAASFERLVIDPVFPLRFRKSKKDHAGKIQPVGFQGVLKVVNPDAMIALVRNGVGPAKAFGCGKSAGCRLQAGISFRPDFPFQRLGGGLLFCSG